jgi:DNA-binding Xre family transcriptional regulator
MAIQWKLKTYLATQHGIYNALAFQRKITLKTGIIVSLQNLCNYLEHKPKQLPLQTAELFVSALECQLEDFLQITPLTLKTLGEPKKHSYKNTPHSKRAIQSFPNPDDYMQ